MENLYSIIPPGLMRNENDSSSNMGEDINSMPIGMAYVPMQVWRDIYEQDKGMMRGTIFSELDMPFKGAKR